MSKWDTVKKWAGILIPDVIAAGVGAWAGSELAEMRGEKGEKPTVGEMVGVALAKRYALDRAAFLRMLHEIDVRTKGGLKAILNLYQKELKGRQYVVVGRRRKWEEWITRRLLVIPVRNRETEYRRLNDILKKNRAAFFAELEILNNDGWQQDAAEVCLRVKAGGKKVLRASDNEIANVTRVLRLWLAKKGVQ